MCKKIVVSALAVIVIQLRWRGKAGTAIYASLRMLVQLLLIGYVLIYILRTDPKATNGKLVLDVDIRALTMDGDTTTNYTMLPDDRLIISPVTDSNIGGAARSTHR